MNNEKNRILAQLQRLRSAKPRHLWATAGVAGFSLLGMVAAFGTAPNTETRDAPLRQTIVEHLASPRTESSGAAADPFVREERIRQGDSVANLIDRLGVLDGDAMEFLRSSPDASAIFRQMSPAKHVTARVDAQGRLLSLVFPLNGGKDQALQVERRGDGFVVSEQSLPLETQVLMKSAVIRHSLFAATDAAGIPDAVAMQLADIFGGDIDFHRDLRKGDRFSVIFESINHLGRQVRVGRILAAEFVNDGKTHRAAWFEAEDGKGGYYSAEGKNIRKAFLRSPLEFSRITSGFSSSRFHPVLQRWRAHRGVDYGAPVGTRVRATGDGVVEFVGNQGGYGKAVVLRHQSRYSTLYGHLSGFAAGIRKGMRIVQGDVIGFVGATGLASGPHLHYEFRINDVHQNPLAVVLPSSPPLAPAQLVRFRDQARDRFARIELMQGADLALLD